MSRGAATLSDLLVEARAGFAHGENVDGGILQFRMNNITNQGQVDLAKKRRVPRNSRNIDAFLLEAGDVLFNATNSPDLVGKAAYFPGLTEPAVFSNHFLRLRPRADRLDGRYLARWLNLQFDDGRFKKMCRQWVNQATVNRESLLALRLPLPPLSEQRQIADILDNAEALRSTRRAALARINALKQSIFFQMFGDGQSILQKWPTKRLGELLNFLTSGSRGWAKYYAETGDLFLRIQNVRRGELLLDDVTHVNAPDTAEARRTRVRPNDVLLSITADLGRTAVVPDGLGNAFINQHLAILRTTSIAPQFLSSYLASPAGQRQILGRNKQGVKAGLNFDDVRSLLVPVPPSSLQEDFVRRLAVVQRLRTASDLALVESHALFASLQHRAFSGTL